MFKFKLLIIKFIDKIFYRNFFFAYKILYFLYKDFTDRKKIKALKKIVKPGMNVLDIGANIGYYSILFSKLIGDKGRVYSFEPDQLNFLYLEKNTKKCGNVTCYNLAVGEKSGDVMLYHSDILNTDCQTYDSGENRKKTKVGCVAIDDYFRNGKKLDFVKIDIQGYDYFAIKGMMKTLEQSDAVVIMGEFWPFGLQKAGVEPARYIELLENIGFEVRFAENYNREKLFKTTNNCLFYPDFFAFKKHTDGKLKGSDA